MDNNGWKKLLSTRGTLIAIAFSALVAAIQPLHQFQDVFETGDRELNLNFRARINELYLAIQPVAEKLLDENEPTSEDYKIAVDLKGASLKVAKLEAIKYGFVRRALDKFKLYLSDKEEGFEVFPGLEFDSNVFHLILNRLKNRAYFDAYHINSSELVSEIYRLTGGYRSIRKDPLELEKFKKLRKSFLDDMWIANSDSQTEDSLSAVLDDQNNEYERQELLDKFDSLIEEIMNFKGCPRSEYANRGSNLLKPVFCVKDMSVYSKLYIGRNLLADIKLDSDRYERFVAGNKDMGDLRKRNNDPQPRTLEYYLTWYLP